MKRLIFSLNVFLLGVCAFAQVESADLTISIDTDLLAYTTLGGYALWGVVEFDQNQLAVSYVNYPNRYKSYYKETGLKELDRFIRVGYERYFSQKKNSYWGYIGEFHWRLLEEDGSTENIEDTHIKTGPILGYHWYPFSGSETFFNNFSVKFWAGPVFRPSWENEEQTFKQTGSIYETPSPVAVSLGINVSYSILEF